MLKNIIPFFRDPITPDQIVDSQWIVNHPGTLYRRKAMIQAGGYGIRSTAEDLDMHRRLVVEGFKLDNNNEALINYRLHSNQLSVRTDITANTKATKERPMVRRPRLIAANYFSVDDNSAGGGSNQYYNLIKYLSNYYRVKWLHFLKDGMRPKETSPVQSVLTDQLAWEDEEVDFHDINKLVKIIKEFQPDLLLPSYWNICHILENALDTAKLGDRRPPLYVRAEHCGFLAGELGLKTAVTDATRHCYDIQLKQKHDEIDCYKRADAILCVSEPDAEAIRKECPGKPVYVVQDPEPTPARFYNPNTKSKDIVFLGGTFHRGNVDALFWFIEQVWPIFSPLCPDSKLLITGVEEPGMYNMVKELIERTKNVEFIGFVDDLSSIFSTVACSIAPVISGAGIKVKALSSFAHECPCILTEMVAGEMQLSNDFAPMIGKDTQDYAEKLANVIKNKSVRAQIVKLVKRINSYFSVTTRNRKLATALNLPGSGVPRILCAANCITLPLEGRGHHLFQARSDSLRRLLGGEINNADYSKLDKYFKPHMVTPLPKVIDASQYDAFIWSAMVDETTHAVDLDGWAFGPNWRYSDSLKVPQEQFFTDYKLIPKLTKAERELNYREVDRLLRVVNPTIRRILVEYDTSRFLRDYPEKAQSYIEAAKHMREVLSSLGWEVYSIPANAPARPNDEHWAHYNFSYTIDFLNSIVGEPTDVI